MTIEEAKDLMQWLLDRGATHINIGDLCSASFQPMLPSPREPERPAQPLDERTGFTESELYASVE